MENQNIYGQPAPDFGALLESVKENGRQIQEIVERQEKERQEREKEREKERQEREKHRLSGVIPADQRLDPVQGMCDIDTRL